MAIRQRADNTLRLVNGDAVDPHDCLFINPEIANLSDKMSDMSQAEWDDTTGKVRIEKQPHGPGERKPKSPDAFDGSRLAFSYDARRGLKQSA